MTTFTPSAAPTPVPTPTFAGLERCRSVLRHINGLAEDGEWHCQLLEGHDGVCLDLDGTTW